MLYQLILATLFHNIYDPHRPPPQSRLGTGIIRVRSVAVFKIIVAVSRPCLQWRHHSRAWQGVCPAKNASALPVALSAALAVKALIRLFIKCKIMANIRRGPNLIAL